MAKNTRALDAKRLFPVQLSTFCQLFSEKASFYNVSPDTAITGLSFGAFYKPSEPGYLHICGADDNYVIQRIHEGGAAALTDHIIEGIPCVVVQDLNSAVFAIAQWAYQAIGLPAVIISGSVGKTTTKRMISSVLAKRERIFTIHENRNMLNDLCCFLQDIKTADQLVVWEVSENQVSETEYSSRVLKPEIAVITNVGDSHVGSIPGGKKALIQSFQLLTAGMPENGIVIINADDPGTADVRFDRKIVTVGIDDTAADCVAYNIVNTPKGAAFDLRFRGETTRIRLSVFGKHNIYNAMMAFVVGSLRGVERKAILSALKSFHNVGIRQNIISLGEELLYVDCYNASAISVSYALQCFCDLSGTHGKRVAILGDIAEIDGYEEKTYREIAAAIDASTIDVLLTYGSKSSMLHNFVTREIEKKHCASSGELNQCLAEMRKKGKNTYLFKASRSMTLEQNIRAVFPFHYYFMKIVENATKEYIWKE